MSDEMNTLKALMKNKDTMKLTDLFDEMDVFVNEVDMNQILSLNHWTLNDENPNLSEDDLAYIDHFRIKDGIHLMKVEDKTIYYFWVSEGKLRQWEAFDTKEWQKKDN